MKSFLTLARTNASNGVELSLHAKDTHFFLRVNGEPLMATNAAESEKTMATLACEHIGKKRAPRVLIGGLGFGFTLQRVLELLGAGAQVEVVELFPEVVKWNREFLQEVNGPALADERAVVSLGDVLQSIAKAKPAIYDAILLDVDNGPSAMVHKSNARLYERQGLAFLIEALKPNGRVTFWSAFPDPAFAGRLRKAGFQVQIVPAKSYPQAKRHAHTIFVADRRLEQQGKKK